MSKRARALLYIILAVAYFVFNFFLYRTRETILSSLFLGLFWGFSFLSILVALDPDFIWDKRVLKGQIILAIIIICFFTFLHKELIMKNFASFLLEFIILIFACWIFIKFPRLWKKRIEKQG
ncbi:MAG: hypothetical protein DSO07_08485 [Thermoproteota archaeon]|uniref:Uncharacterized protein n=1 Tax=Candidatus Methanodesulfokora washburnensis TaxID=2478471 RepID=A0A429GEN0_9CREN|nr:hypothetical protein D6D85_14260 [Candidatus Methanodesulfokores washburnensis]TDA40685.1 MAG: hypothetical protein DSO07_08485 [Candidatus Korarchaeota archaeon]